MKIPQILKSYASIPNVYGLNIDGSYSLTLKRNLARLWVYKKLMHRSTAYARYCREFLPNTSFQNRNFSEHINTYSIKDFSDNLSKIGVSTYSDALPSSSYEKLLNEIREVDPLRSFDCKYGNVKCWNNSLSASNSDAINRLQNYVAESASQCLLKIIPERVKCNYQVLMKDANDADIGDINTLMHSDRFIPTLKFFYYPFDCSIEDAPFRYIPYSHLQGGSFFEAYKEFYADISLERKPFFPCTINNFTGNPIQNITVKANTLVGAFTNGIHSRAPFPETTYSQLKQRKSIQFLIYNQQTKLSLLR